MSIRTTVTLDEDVIERVKDESRSRGTSFKDTLNSLLRVALLQGDKPRARKFEITPVHMGYRDGLDHDNIESLLEYGEGDGAPVKLLDANILLYAYNADSPQHRAAAAWLTDLLKAANRSLFHGLLFGPLFVYRQISESGQIRYQPKGLLQCG